MNALQHEISSTYARTLVLLAETKRKAYWSGYIEGAVSAFGVVGIYFIVTKI